MAGKDWKGAVAEKMGGDKSAPKKEIKSITTTKSHNGGHVHVHKHHNPDAHPDETHTTKGDDEMVQHMMQNAGTPNPGEAEADPSAAPAAQMTASPSAPPAGAPMASAAPGGM